ncbi:MAG TPA: hypothetical protein VG755_09765 [Nannocystaceae bacterium]|nr:hypothetical protein [Nannocystaceae bacterium]
MPGEANEAAMYVWIVFLSLIIPNPPVTTPGVSSDDDDPMRYRGIERLLAKFESEEQPKKIP